MIAKTVTSAALVLALQIAPALAKSVRVIGSWKIEDKRDPISGKPWIIAQAGGAGSWIQIRCEAVSDAGKGNLPFLVVGIGTRQSLNDGDKAEGKIKIDDNPAQSIVVVVINAQEGAGGALLQRNLYEQILKATSISVRVSPKQSSETSFTLPVNRTKLALEAVAKACPIDAAPETL